jgi:hypothetical protein
MPAHLRVSVSDRPGALAALTSALAHVGVNVLSVAVLEREQGRAVDDLVIDTPYQRPLDAVARAVDGCPGARVLGLRHVVEPAGGGDVELALQLVLSPERALATVVDGLPHVLLADWAAAFDRARPREPVYETPNSPLPLPPTSGPLDRPRAMTVDGEALLLAQLPDRPLRVLVGRYEGPAFTRGEVQRAASLVAIAGAMGRATSAAGEACA